MGAGFPGDVTRTFPSSIEADTVDADDPPTQYGQAVLIDSSTQGVRQFVAGDASDSVVATPRGFVARPFPFQQQSASNFGAIGLGTGAPPTSGIIDVLRSGSINVQLNVGSVAPVKGNPVYVWCAATSGNHLQGGFETAFSSGNTVELDPRFYSFAGGMDASSVTEIFANI